MGQPFVILSHNIDLTTLNITHIVEPSCKILEMGLLGLTGTTTFCQIFLTISFCYQDIPICYNIFLRAR